MAGDEVARVIIRRLTNFEAPLLVELAMSMRTGPEIRRLDLPRRARRAMLFGGLARAGAGEGVRTVVIRVPGGIIGKHVSVSGSGVCGRGCAVMAVTVAMAWSRHARARAYGYRVVPTPAGGVSGAAAAWCGDGDGDGGRRRDAAAWCRGASRR